MQELNEVSMKQEYQYSEESMEKKIYVIWSNIFILV